MDDIPQEESESQVMEDNNDNGLYDVIENSTSNEIVDSRPDQIKDLGTYGEIMELEGKNEIFVLHPLAQTLKDGQGGMILHDEKNEMGKAIKHIAKQISASAMKGQLLDMMKIPTPAYIHWKGSHLNLISNDYISLQYLNKATQITDPLERMKLIVTFFVASNFVNQTLVNCKVPLNPILGETLQREMKTGERIYCEQISHHPPVSAFEIYGPNDEYKLYGHQQLKASLSGASAFGGSKIGKCTIEFQDGYTVQFTKTPSLVIENIFSKTKKAVYYDNISFMDEENGIEGVIHYNPNFNKGLTGIAYRNTFGWLPGMNGLGQNKDQGRVARADDVNVEIQKVDVDGKKSNNEVLSKGVGSWLSHLILDDEVVWRIEQEVYQWDSISSEQNNRFSDGTILLVSDTNSREDFKEMLTEQWEQAEEHKLQLEKLQRKDKTNRTAAEKNRKKHK